MTSWFHNPTCMSNFSRLKKISLPRSSLHRVDYSTKFVAFKKYSMVIFLKLFATKRNPSILWPWAQQSQTLASAWRHRCRSCTETLQLTPCFWIHLALLTLFSPFPGLCFYVKCVWSIAARRPDVFHEIGGWSENTIHLSVRFTVAWDRLTWS